MSSLKSSLLLIFKSLHINLSEQNTNLSLTRRIQLLFFWIFIYLELWLLVKALQKNLVGENRLSTNIPTAVHSSPVIQKRVVHVHSRRVQMGKKKWQKFRKVLFKNRSIESSVGGKFHLRKNAKLKCFVYYTTEAKIRKITNNLKYHWQDNNAFKSSCNIFNRLSYVKPLGATLALQSHKHMLASQLVFTLQL